RRERRPRNLPAGELAERPIEVDVEAELAQRLPRAVGEVAAAAGEERVKRVRVCAAELRLGAQAAGKPAYASVRLGDACAAREIALERLVRRGITLLRQVADVDAGAAANRATVGHVDTGEQAAQRRLADTVRSDETDARTRRHGEIDVGEDDLGTVELRDAVCGEHADLLTKSE